MSSSGSENKMPPARMTTKQSPDEEKNISVVKEYMRIAYSPSENKGRKSVEHLCADDAWFWAPTTFPGVKSPQDYAESHSHVMASVADLHIVCYDQVFAKDGHVLLRYTAEGSHCGEPHNGIEKTGNKAKWSAAAIFEVEDGKVKSFTKDWDKLHMW
ncbi:NTF2-like protein, partial [Aureobasidium melanogenum]